MGRIGAAQRQTQLANLIWQLKLRAQDAFGARDTLRMLIADPQRLADLLDRAVQSGDPSLVRLADDIRRLQEMPVPGAGGRSPSRLWIGAALGALAVLAAALLTAALWSPDGGWPTRTVLRLHGSNTVGERLAPALVEAWLKRQGAGSVEIVPGATPVERALVGGFALAGEQRRVELHAHGSGTAFEDMARGAADIGMASRRIKPGEVEALRERFGDLRSPAGEHVVGLDGLAVVVNVANPVGALTREQVAALFSGRVGNWSELVAGYSQPVALHARDDHSGTWDTFESLVLDPSGVGLAPTATRYESSSALSAAVASDPGAIGFIGLPYVGKTRAIGIADTAHSLPVVPTPFTVGTEDYPLSRRLYLYAGTGTVAPEVDDFIRFALSDAGQAVVAEAGLVPLTVRAEALPVPRDAPGDYRDLAAIALRLSVNFRFEAGSDRLDTRAERDLDRLVDYLAQHPGRGLMLFGFSDGASGEETRALSLARAEQVAQALQTRGIAPQAVRGYGAAMPLASNDSDAGRQRNRRVEVWLR